MWAGYGQATAVSAPWLARLACRRVPHGYPCFVFHGGIDEANAKCYRQDEIALRLISSTFICLLSVGLVAEVRFSSETRFWCSFVSRIYLSDNLWYSVLCLISQCSFWFPVVLSCYLSDSFTFDVHFLVSFLSLVSDSGSHLVEYEHSTYYAHTALLYLFLHTACCVFVSQQDSSAVRPCTI